MKNILLLISILLLSGKNFSQAALTPNDLVTGTETSRLEEQTQITDETCPPILVKAYPNPATGFIHFTITGCNGKWLRIYNLFGEYLETKDISSVSTFLISLNMFVRGTYIYTITDDTGNILIEDKFIVE